MLSKLSYIDHFVGTYKAIRTDFLGQNTMPDCEFAYPLSFASLV